MICLLLVALFSISLNVINLVYHLTLVENVMLYLPFLQHHHILNQWDVLFHVLCITRATTNDSILINGYKMSGNSQFPGAQG